MKFLTLLAVSLMGFSHFAFGHGNLSPKKTESLKIAGKEISLQYSAPSVRGRVGKLFSANGLMSKDPTYPVWRAGADEATTLHTDGNLEIGGLSVPKGTYTLFINLKDPANWELIINKQTGQWGLKYDKEKDLGRVRMTMGKPAELVETLKYTLSDAGDQKGTLELAWEDRTASVPFTVK